MMSTLTALQSAQQRLAAHYERQRPMLLPDEDRAYLSLFGKMEFMIAFLSLPPDLAAKLPASGNGSMSEAKKMAAEMASDVDAFVVNEENTETVCPADVRQAAKMQRSAGRAIYCGEDRNPGKIFRELPNGQSDVLRESNGKVLCPMNENMRFLESIDSEAKAVIIDGIAAHCGTTVEAIIDELSSPDADHVLNYMIEPARSAALALMRKHGFRA